MHRRTFLSGAITGAAAIAAPGASREAKADSAIHAGVPGLPAKAMVLFQGDSITDGGRWRDSTDPNHVFGQSYPYLLAAHCGGHYPERGWQFANRGIGGNTVLDLAARWQKDTLALAPDVLSILIGINDTLSVCCAANDKPGISVDHYAEVYGKLLTTTRAALPKVGLVMCEPFTLPGRANAQDFDRFKKDVEARQAVVATLARRYEAVLVRLQGVFDAALRRAPAPYWIWDGVHPTYAGHQLIADQWLRAVDAAHIGDAMTPKKVMR